MTTIRHHTINAGGQATFIREAGDPARPALVLLHGFPSSSRQYVRLIDRLSASWHVVAPDYPGFGLSAPVSGSPTFDRLAEATATALDAVGVGDYGVFMFDIGAPIGFLVALNHDTRVRVVISQNANVYTGGFGPAAGALAEWWADRAAGQPAIDGFVTIDGTRAQWLAGARDPEFIDPSQYHADQAVLDLPGRADYMKDLLWDYQNIVPRFPEFHAWLRGRSPNLLAIWGRHDPFFIPAGAEAFRHDLPDAEVVLLDTGHFALEEESESVASTVSTFLDKHLR